MEDELEQLFNSLIKKGRVPFGIYGNWDLEWERIYIEEQDEYTNEYRHKVYLINVDYVEFNWLCYEDKHFSDRFSLREITSKWSWLWQFVCENGMVKITEENSLCNWLFWEKIYYDETHTEKLYKNDNYQYRLIESVLKDEPELEQLLLNNIKV